MQLTREVTLTGELGTKGRAAGWIVRKDSAGTTTRE
jgi:hypothetical protein